MGPGSGINPDLDPGPGFGRGQRPPSRTLPPRSGLRPSPPAGAGAGTNSDLDPGPGPGRDRRPPSRTLPLGAVYGLPARRHRPGGPTPAPPRRYGTARDPTGAPLPAERRRGSRVATAADVLALRPGARCRPAVTLVGTSLLGTGRHAPTTPKPPDAHAPRPRPRPRRPRGHAHAATPTPTRPRPRPRGHGVGSSPGRSLLTTRHPPHTRTLTPHGHPPPTPHAHPPRTHTRPPPATAPSPPASPRRPILKRSLSTSPPPGPTMAVGRKGRQNGTDRINQAGAGGAGGEGRQAPDGPDG